MFFIPVVLGLNIEDIQYVGSSLVDNLVDFAVALLDIVGSIGSSTVNSSNTTGADIPR